jgi:uncharacterized repeat protein (TIGR01451 family)
MMATMQHISKLQAIHEPADLAAQPTAPRRRWSRLIGLALIELILGMLILLPVLRVASAHAQPGGSEADLQSDASALNIPTIDVFHTQNQSFPAAPLQQAAATSLTIEILSSPWATVDSNGTNASGVLPGVFVVEAAITNTDATTATDVQLELVYDDPGTGWELVTGEDPFRTIDVPPLSAYYVYWFAGYPVTATQGITHPYTVTVSYLDTSPVATETVTARDAQDTGNQGLAQTNLQVVVGAAFTLTQVYTIGTNPDDAVFSPVGNNDFDASSFYLLSSQVRYYDTAQTQETTFSERLYFEPVPNLPDDSQPDYAEVTYTFIALRSSNTYLCPYAAIRFKQNPKYDQQFCTAPATVVITGTLNLSQTKQVSSDTIEQGQVLTYTITYTNTGDQALQNGWVWDEVLPTNTVSIITTSINPPSDPDETTQERLAWNLGTVPTGTGTLTFAVRVDGGGQDLGDGTLLVNDAFYGVSPFGNLPTVEAFTGTATTTVRAPMISFSKTDGQDYARPGDLLTYTLSITNASQSMATSNLIITDALPDYLTLVGPTSPITDSQNGQTLVWNSLTVPVSSTLDITIPVRVNLDVPDLITLTNVATATYQNTSGSHTFAPQTDVDANIVHAPILTITQPPDGYVTSTSTITVLGTTNPTATVTLTNTATGVPRQVTADNSGAFTITDVSLVSGTNLLVGQATDVHGSSTTDEVTVLVDTTPDANTLTITFPPHGYVTSTLTITGLGVTDPAATVTLTNTATGLSHQVTADNSGAFTITGVSLISGTNLLQGRSIDPFGNPAVDDVTVLVDTTPNTNFLTITYPPDGYVTSTLAITVMGTTNPAATIAITNTATGLPYFTTADNSGVFTRTGVNLVSGTNLLQGRSSDPFGNRADDDVTVLVDTTPDTNTLTITFPPHGYVTTTLTITALGITDPAATVTLTNTATGVPYQVTADNGGAFTLASVSLVSGTNLLDGRSIDLFGNPAVDDVTVLVDTTPLTNFLIITSPPEGYATSALTITVLGTTNPAATVTLTNTATGVPYQVTADNSGAFTLTSVNLVSGTNLLQGRSLDPFGNPADDDVTVLVDTTPDTNTLTITFPPNPYVTSTLTITALGSTDPVATVTLTNTATGAPHQVTADNNGAFTLTSVSLVSGTNLLDGQSVDPVGNPATDQTTVLVDTTPLTNFLTITSPISGTSTIETTTQVQGLTNPASLVIINLDTSPITYTTTANNSGQFTVPDVGLAPGNNTITATGTDPFGNSASDSVVVTVAGDLYLPIIVKNHQ